MPCVWGQQWIPVRADQTEGGVFIFGRFACRMMAHFFTEKNKLTQHCPLQTKCLSFHVITNLLRGSRVLVETAGLCFEAEVVWPVAGQQEQWICGEVQGLCCVQERRDDGEQEQTGCKQFFNIVLRFLYFARVFPVWETFYFALTTFMLYKVQFSSTTSIWRLFTHTEFTFNFRNS